MKNNNVLEYKGYHTKVEFIAENRILYGKIEGINDLVTFETSDSNNVEKEFHAAVDDYLAFCEEIGQSPDKECSGVFNVRIQPELHRKLSLEADKEGISLNALVARVLQQHTVQLDDNQSVQSQENIKEFSIPADWHKTMSAQPNNLFETMNPDMSRFLS